MKLGVLIILFLGSITLNAQKKAYQIYNANGHKITYKKMLKKLAKADIVFFGEDHNNPIAHWLELELTIDLFKKRQLILGAEMFETDNQQGLSDYISGVIDAKQLKDTIRLWKNYKTDYKPLVEFAKKNQIEFIATNVPRRYASLVYHKGFKGLDSLSENEKQWFPKIPIKYDASLPGYVKMLNMMEGHSGDNLPKSQALKDATMANSIANNYEVGKLFFHLNGSYHSNDYEGILWYLKQQLPQVKIVTICLTEQKSILKVAADNKNKANFIILVPDTMTKTN
ncbi:MAG: ChaN family lipoprotein [Flavobacteriaceae bacterium]|nr:ChaN family lipoprotein [Flavobacteriaceae bacterium]